MVVFNIHQMDIELLLIVGLITFFFSFGVQVGFYLWYKYHQHYLVTQYKTVFDYTSGVIGDGLLVPLTNIFAVMTMFSIAEGFLNFERWLYAGLTGFTITYLFHVGQEYYKLINWTMPKVGHWNLLGTYHAFFMFFESTFLCYILYSYLQSTARDGNFSNYSFSYSLLVLALFLISFIYDYWNPLFKKLLK